MKQYFPYLMHCFLLMTLKTRPTCSVTVLLILPVEVVLEAGQPLELNYFIIT